MKQSDIEKRFAEINALKPEEPTASEIAAIAAASQEDDTDTVTLEEYNAAREYSGKILVRIPKELHRQLAKLAKDNGVSINQYILYKLAK